MRGCWPASSLLSAGFDPLAAASDTDAAREQFKTGQYEKCLETAQKAIKDGAYSIQWRLLEIESLLALGRYQEAAERTDAAIRDSRTDIRLLTLAYTVYQQTGQANQAGQTLTMVYRIASYRRSEYLTGAETVGLGRCLLALGVEPRVVLENFYNVALRSDPNCREAYLAIGSLAQAKQDFKLAADKYQEALKRFGDDPDVHYGLAQAFYHSDRKAMIASLDAALHVNPRHVPALVSAGRAPDRLRGPRRGRQDPGPGPGGQSLGPGRLGVPSGARPSGERSQWGQRPPGQCTEVLADQSPGGLPDRQKAVAELSFHRRRRLSTPGVEV